MKPVFVKTENYNAFHAALKGLANRGAEECQIIVVDGEPGLGKTTVLQRWASENACVYLRAKTEWSPGWFMAELLSELRIQTPSRHEARFKMALGALAERADLAGRTDRQFAVVIDEADHISGRKAVIETMRDLSDLAQVAFVLVGMGSIRDNLTRFPQIGSRVSGYVRFERADLEQVQYFLAEACAVPVAEDLARFVTQATSGYTREIKEAIQSIERFGRRNPPAGKQGLTVEEMAGEHLINDRKSGQPIHIPGGVS